jgi:hypothetical protein
MLLRALLGCHGEVAEREHQPSVRFIHPSIPAGPLEQTAKTHVGLSSVPRRRDVLVFPQ